MLNLSVVIASCLNKPERKEYLLKTVESIRENLGVIEILIGFDKYGCEINGIKCYTHEKGLGHSWNWGIQNSSNNYVLQIEDDWELTPQKGIGFLYDSFVNKIKIIEKFDGIYRFGNLCSKNSKWVDGCKELSIEEYKFCELNKPKKYEYNNFSMFYYSNQPHMKNKSLHDKVGCYAECEPPHFVESDMCKKYYDSNQRMFFSYVDDFDFVHLGNISARKNI